MRTIKMVSAILGMLLLWGLSAAEQGVAETQAYFDLRFQVVPTTHITGIGQQEAYQVNPFVVNVGLGFSSASDLFVVDTNYKYWSPTNWQNRLDKSVQAKEAYMSFDVFSYFGGWQKSILGTTPFTQSLLSMLGSQGINSQPEFAIQRNFSTSTAQFMYFDDRQYTTPATATYGRRISMNTYIGPANSVDSLFDSLGDSNALLAYLSSLIGKDVFSFLEVACISMPGTSGVSQGYSGTAMLLSVDMHTNGAQVEVVPLPASLWLLLAGGGPLLALCRRHS